ncbi:hypothetical protein FRC02_003817 [Tulasnella sp. 418]|nr:hypothetical protein FRC02_003817 [Tulasnella sp. 418]
MSEIDSQVQREIMNARRQRNTLAPVHCLPAELLCEIFELHTSEIHEDALTTFTIHEEYLRGDETEDWHHPGGMKSIYSRTVNVATVCSHWYQLALTTPRLWCYLDSRHSLDLTSLLLERSASTPLHISCLKGVDQGHEGRFMGLIEPHLERWISFNTASGNPTLLESIIADERSTPSLERFIIHRCGWVRSVPSFIVEQSPRLHDLHIAAMVCPPGIMELSNLTNLSMSGDIGNSEFQMGQYERLFSMNPQLETIFLSGSSLHGEVSLVSIRLHKLKTIVLDRVRPELTAALLLSIFPGENNYPTIRVFGGWSYSQPLLGGSSKGNLLHMVQDNMYWLSILCHSRDEGIPLITTGMERCGVPLTLLEIRTGMSSMNPQIAASLLGPNGSSTLRHLEVQFRYKTDSAFISSRLHLCPSLKHLTIIACDDQIRGHIEALCFLATETLPGGSHLPQLEVLTLKGLSTLQRVFTAVVEARYGHSRKELLESDLCKELETLRVYAPIRPDELIETMELYVTSRGVRLELLPAEN